MSREKGERISTEMEPKEDANVELYKVTIRDARYIMNRYKAPYPEEAWETIRKLLYNPKLKGIPSGN